MERKHAAERYGVWCAGMNFIRPGFPGSPGSFKDLFLLAAAPDPTGGGRGSGGAGGGVGGSGGAAGGIGEGTLMDDSAGPPGPVNLPGVGGATSTVQKLSTLFPQCVCIYAPQVRAVGGVSRLCFFSRLLFRYRQGQLARDACR